MFPNYVSKVSDLLDQMKIGFGDRENCACVVENMYWQTWQLFTIFANYQVYSRVCAASAASLTVLPEAF